MEAMLGISCTDNKKYQEKSHLRCLADKGVGWQVGGPFFPLSWSCLRLSPSLSGLNLLLGGLGLNLLGRLKQLQELDLSDNQLETLPADLGLPTLHAPIVPTTS